MLVALLLTGAASEPRPVPIPGTTLKLGMPMVTADSLAHLRGTPGAPNRRKGDAKFFGLEAETEADFAAGNLTHVRFVLPAASAHSRDYIEDQLRNAGMHRACEVFDTKSHDCVWTSDVALRVVWTPERLTAEATRPGNASEPEAAAEDDSTAAAAHEARADSLRARTLAGGASPVAASAPATAGAASVAAGAAPVGPAAATTAAAIRANSLPTAAPMLADTLRLSGPFSPATAIQPDVIGVRPSATLPDAAKRAGIQGTVLVLATVDTAGAVTTTTILRSIAELDDAAQDTARKYRFAPLIVDGHATGFRVVLPCTFVAHGP
jgi:TonB family protein